MPLFRSVEKTDRLKTSRGIFEVWYWLDRFVPWYMRYEAIVNLKTEIITEEGFKKFITSKPAFYHVDEAMDELSKTFGDLFEKAALKEKRDKHGWRMKQKMKWERRRGGEQRTY